MIDLIYSVAIFIIRQKRIPNLISPRRFTDKILLLKLKKHTKLAPLRKLVSDRLAVRPFILSKNSTCKLIDVLWTGESLSATDWDNLPNKFVIKATHGSQMVKIVDKKIDEYNSVRSLSTSWLNFDYYKLGREWVYKDTPRKLIVEEFIEFSGDVPPDYKFFCLNGKVKLIQVDLERFTSHKRNIYNENFDLLDVKFLYENGSYLPKPKLFDDAVLISEKLAEDFDFIRVDLYILDDVIYFGEMTNFPENTLGHFSSNLFDISLGEKLELES